MNYERIKKKVEQSGLRGLSAAALRHAALVMDNKSGNQLDRFGFRNHQLSAYRVLSRYISFKGKDILEVGGTQSCESVYPFLKDGARRAVVTGLDHITQEKNYKKYSLQVINADALKLSSRFDSCSFDAVYGLSIVEHISSPKIFLDEVYTILKPGGIAFFEGNPIWSSPKGHHLWIATWSGAYQDKATANYLFSGWPDTSSTNPLPDWSHLLMDSDQMRAYLTKKSVPGTDINCIVDWVFFSNQINRINMSKIAEAYTRSKLIVLEANTLRVGVPADMRTVLREKNGDGIDYGISGVSYVLAKLR